MMRFLLAIAAAATLSAQPRTGPAVGTHIPPVEAVDQTGKSQTFETLRGPHGLALLFVRSADW